MEGFVCACTEEAKINKKGAKSTVAARDVRCTKRRQFPMRISSDMAAAPSNWVLHPWGCSPDVTALKRDAEDDEVSTMQAALVNRRIHGAAAIGPMILRD